MSVTVINPSGSQNYQAIISCERFQERAAIWKEKTGRNLVVELNEDGQLIQFWHPDSTQKSLPYLTLLQSLALYSDCDPSCFLYSCVSSRIEYAA